MALIEKGADASIFIRGKTQKVAPIWTILILNLALLLMGIGTAIFVASIFVHSLGVKQEVAYPGTIFLLAGVGLMVGFNMTNKLDKEN